MPGTGRTEAFSDGVFAIVITLLVLDLANPHYRPGGLGAALAEQWPSYLAFGFSFVYVGVIWLNHHALFRRISRLDLGLNWINLGVLLGAVIIPFPPSWPGRSPRATITTSGWRSSCTRSQQPSCPPPG